MTRLSIIFLGLGAFFLIGIGIHAGLVNMASGDGAPAKRAAGT